MIGPSPACWGPREDQDERLCGLKADQYEERRGREHAPERMGFGENRLLMCCVMNRQETAIPDGRTAGLQARF